MNTPLITIEYKEYLTLKKTKAEQRIEILKSIREYIKDDYINTKDDLLRIIKSLENNYQNILDNMEEGDNK